MNIKHFFKKNISWHEINTIPILVDLNSLPKHLQDQIQYFESESLQKEQYNLSPWQKSYVTRFLDVFKRQELKGKLVLDNATGSGYMAIELAKLGADVIATDLTLKYLIDLKQHAYEQGVDNKIFCLCCSSEDLPFRDAIFDYTLSNAILEHLPKEKLAIKELERVTKIGGGLMIAVPISYKLLNPLLGLVNYLHDKRIGHLRRYNRKIIIQKFSNCKLLKVYYTGHTSKVIKTLLNIIFHKTVFSEEKMEIQDRVLENKARWSSNIISFLQRK